MDKIPKRRTIEIPRYRTVCFVDNRGHELAIDLAIMPDLASLTLFGEHWLAYEIERLVTIEQNLVNNIEII